MEAATIREHAGTYSMTDYERHQRRDGPETRGNGGDCTQRPPRDVTTGQRPPLIAETTRDVTTGQRPPLIAKTTRDVTTGQRPPLIAETTRDVTTGQRPPLIAETTRDMTSGHGGGDGRPEEKHSTVWGRRETVTDPYRDGSGYEKARHAMSPSPSSMYDGAPHLISGYERLSVERAHTMKDFEKQITELKKENFNLKLRIYFLEEQIQRRGNTSNDELHRMNIELKVEVESLKHDFKEKHDLLVRASKAMETLAGQHDLAVQRLRDEHLSLLQDMEEAHQHKVHLLEAEIDKEKAELEKVCVLLDQERMQRFSAEERLMAVNEQYNKNMGVLEERDWIIQCLNETVHSKDALIAQLEKQIASMMPYDKTGKSTSSPYQEGKDLSGAPNKDFVDGKEDVSECPKKMKEMDDLINELRQKLEANRASATAEEKNALKREKAIQGLTMALKKKTQENDKLLNQIDNLNAALANAREASQRGQIQNLKESSHPEYKKVIFTLQAEQDVYNRLLNYERESGSHQKEMESVALLRRWLEENIRANQELRKIMEAQIMAQYKGDDSMSFLGDQTSYLSLDHLDHPEYFCARAPQGAAINEDNVIREDAATQTQGEDVANLKGHQESQSDLPFNENAETGRGGNDTRPSRQNPMSSATQTEPMTFSDKSSLVDVSRSPNKSAEFMVTVQEKNDTLQRSPQTRSIGDFQGYKRQRADNFSLSTKKSRLPVLLKSSLSTKLKTDAALTKGGDHECPEDLQTYNSGPCEQLKSVDIEAGSHNTECVGENGLPGQKQKESTLQGVHRDLENPRLTQSLERADIEGTTSKANEEWWMCDDSNLSNTIYRESKNGPLPEKLEQKEVETLSACKEEHRENTDHQLLAESVHLCKQRPPAQNEIQSSEANEGMMKDSAPDLWSPNNVHLDHRYQPEDLQVENVQPYKLQAQTEIHTLTAKEGLIQDMAMKSTDQTFQKDLQAENVHLYAQLRLAQIEIHTLKAHKDTDLSNHSTDQTSDLQAENHRLAEQLGQAQREITTLRASEEVLRWKASQCDFCSHKDEPTIEQALEKELQAENQRLHRQLKLTQIHHNNAPGLSSSSREKMEATHQALQADNPRQLHKTQQEELGAMTDNDIVLDASQSVNQTLQEELQAENYRLTEELKQAQTEIERLQAGRRSIDSTDDSLKLHGSDADDDLSEQSFLDKTITNSVHVDNGDATSDFGDEVCQPNVNNRNAVALRCHHDHHCTECASHRGGRTIQTSSSKRSSTMHTASKYPKMSRSGRSHDDTTSLSKYDLLVQSQARELSLQRQKIKESHNLSVICSKNFYNILKAFENLFPSGALDSNITLGFREQITQTVEWLKELEYKLSDALYGEEDAYSDHSADSLLYTPSRLVPGHRMWADKHGCHVLGLVEDYNALRKQILEAGNVLQEMEAFIDHGVQTAILNMTEHFGNIFFEKLSRTKQSLEEAGCLLKLLWRVSLPVQIHSPYNINQEEEANLEVIRLRKRVSEQEKILSGMVKRVYSENQMKEDIEKLILDQLAITHDILKRAKGNLEVQVVDKLH